MLPWKTTCEPSVATQVQWLCIAGYKIFKSTINMLGYRNFLKNCLLAILSIVQFNHNQTFFKAIFKYCFIVPLFYLNIVFKFTVMDVNKNKKIDFTIFLCFLILTSIGLLTRNFLQLNNFGQFLGDTLGNIGGVIVGSFLFFCASVWLIVSFFFFSVSLDS